MIAEGEFHEDQERIEVLISPKKNDHFPLELLLLLLQSKTITSYFQHQLVDCTLLPILKSKEHNKIKGLFETHSNRDLFGSNVGYSSKFVEDNIARLDQFPDFYQSCQRFINKVDNPEQKPFISRTIDGKYFISLNKQVLMLNAAFVLYKTGTEMYFTKVVPGKQEFYFGGGDFFRPHGNGLYFLKTISHLQMMIGLWESGHLREGLFLKIKSSDVLQTAMYGQFDKGKLHNGWITHQISSSQSTQYLVQEVRLGNIHVQQQPNPSDTNATSNQNQ